MKKSLLVFIILKILFFPAVAQSKYLSDITITESDIKYGNGYTTMPFNYWRYDTCLYSTQMCKYNSSTAASVKVRKEESSIVYEFLRSNSSGLNGISRYDTFQYTFIPQNVNSSRLVRKLLIKEKFIRTDTFQLTVEDTLWFKNSSAIKKVFGKSEAGNQKFLKIYVLKSVDDFGSKMYHYWVERIGVIKLTDEKCWRYSFEMKDDRTKSLEKMFTQLVKVIKTKYKDPYWLSQSCSFE